MAGRPVKINWHNNEGELKRLYQTEKDASIKPRLHSLWLVRQGKQVKEAAELVGTHLRTARQWLAWYREGGVDTVRQKRGGNYDGLPCRLSADQQNALHDHANETGFFTGLKVQQWISEQFSIAYTLDGVYTLLRRLKIRKKVPRPMNVKADEAVQEDYKRLAGWQWIVQSIANLPLGTTELVASS